MSDPRRPSDDYISLDNIKDSFLAIGGVIFIILDGIKRLITRYWLIFVVLVGMGTGLGIVLKRVVTFNSQLNMLVKFNDQNRTVYTEIIGSLSDLIDSKSTERLAMALQIKEDDARLISDITVEKTGKDDPADDTSRRAPFLIAVSLRSIAAADIVQTAITGYINNNPYLKKLKDSQLVYYQGELEFVNSELRKLDSLKTAYNQSISSGKNATIYYNAFDPAEIYKNSAVIMAEKQRVMEWFATQRNAMSIITTVKEERITRKKGVSQIVVGFLAGWVLAFLLAIWQDIKSNIKRQETSQPA